MRDPFTIDDNANMDDFINLELNELRVPVFIEDSDIDENDGGEHLIGLN